MSLGKRLLDLARANVNALLRRDEPDLEEYTDAELATELAQRRARRQREEEARRAREAAERAARDRSATRQSDAGSAKRASSSRTSSTSKTAAGTGNTAGPEARHVAELYAALETPNGADFETVRKNFRVLMRRHHPDLNGGTPAAQRAATERTKKLTAAYDELERMLAPTRR